MNKEEARLVRNLIRNVEVALKRFPNHLPHAHLQKSVNELRDLMIEGRWIRSSVHDSETLDGCPVKVSAATQWHADQIAESL